MIYRTKLTDPPNLNKLKNCELKSSVGQNFKFFYRYPYFMTAIVMATNSLQFWKIFSPNVSTENFHAIISIKITDNLPKIYREPAENSPEIS